MGANSQTAEDLAPVIAMCVDCRRGYVNVNAANPNPSCIACGGRITSITSRPNSWPYTNGAFVTDKQP